MIAFAPGAIPSIASKIDSSTISGSFFATASTAAFIPPPLNASKAATPAPASLPISFSSYPALYVTSTVVGIYSAIAVSSLFVGALFSVKIPLPAFLFSVFCASSTLLIFCVSIALAPDVLP